MPARKTDKTSKPAGGRRAKRTAAPGKAATPLPESMVTGKASSAKAAVGDKPVFAYDGLSSDQLVLGQYMPEQIGAQASRGEGTDQHVGVEEDSQETSRKTSSSVK